MRAISSACFRAERRHWNTDSCSHSPKPSMSRNTRCHHLVFAISKGHLDGRVIRLAPPCTESRVADVPSAHGRRDALAPRDGRRPRRTTAGNRGNRNHCYRRSSFNEAVAQHHGGRPRSERGLSQQLTAVFASGAVKRSGSTRRDASPSTAIEATS
jgi:hypothetical protein